MALHSFNPFSGQNPFAQRGIYRRRPEGMSRDEAVANKRERSKMLEASNLSPERKREVEKILKDKRPKLSEDDMKRILDAEKLIEDANKNEKLSDTQKAHINALREGFTRNGVWGPSAYKRLEHKVESYHRAEEMLKEMNTIIEDPALRKLLQEDIYEWDGEPMDEFLRANRASEKVWEAYGEGALSDEAYEEYKELVEAVGMEAWQPEAYQSVLKEKDKIEQNLKVRDVNTMLQETSKEKITARPLAYLVNEETGERVNPNAKRLTPGTYKFSPGGNRAAEKAVNLGNLSQFIESDTIYIQFAGKENDFAFTRESGKAFNEGLNYPEYVPIKGGDTIRIPGEVAAPAVQEPRPTARATRESLNDERRQEAEDWSEGPREVQWRKDLSAAEEALSYDEKEDRRRSVRIPKELRGRPGTREFRDNFNTLDNGDWVLTQLRELMEVNAAVNGASEFAEPVDVWEAIRRQCGNSGTIRYKEVLKAVLGTKRESKLDDIKTQIGEEKYNQFLVATKRLMDGVDRLARNEMEEVKFKHNYGLTEDARNAMAISGMIFDRSGNKGHTPWNLKRNRNGKSISMQNASELILKDNGLTYSDQRGYLYLIDGEMDLMEHDGKQEWVKDIDMAQFEQKVYELYSTGHDILRVSAKEKRNGKVKIDGKKYAASEVAKKDNLDLDNLSEADILFIRRGVEGGMVMDEGKNEQVRRDMEIATEIPSQFKGATRDALLKLLELGIFTNEEMETYGYDLEEVYGELLIEQRARLEHNGLDVGVGASTEGEWGAGVKKTVFMKRKGRTMVSVDVALHGNTVQQVITPAAGLNLKTELGKDWEYQRGVGVDAVGNQGVYAQIEKSFGEYDISSLFIGGSLSKGRYDDLIASVYGGYKRDIKGVLSRETDELMSEKAELVDDIIDSQFSREANQTALKGMDPEVAGSVIDAFEEILERELMDMALEDLKSVQGTGFAVGLSIKARNIPLGTGIRPVVYGGFAIKGRKKFAYFTPTGIEGHQNKLIQARIKEAVKADMGGEPVSSMVVEAELGLDDKGEMRFGQQAEVSNFSQQRFEDIQREFAKDGIRIEKTAEGKVTIDVLEAYGLITAEADPQGGIEMYPEGNKIVVNLDETDSLAVARVDVYNDRPDFRNTHEVRLIVSGIPGRDLKNVRGTTKLGKRRHDIAERDTSYTEITNQNDMGRTNTATFGSEEAMLAAGVEAEDYSSMEEVKAAQKRLNEVMGALKLNDGISAADKTALEDIALKVIRARNINYDALVDDPEEVRNVQKRIRKEAEKKGLEMNDTKMLYAMNAVAVKSRAARPVSKEAFKKHVQGWNRRSLAQNLDRLGLTTEEANQVADALTERYAEFLNTSYTPDSQGVVISDELISTHVAPGTNGEAMTILNSAAKETRIFEPQAMSVDNLVDNFGMSETLAQKFYAAKMEELYPFGSADNPRKFMQSPLSLALLSQGATVFGAEEAVALADIYESNSASANPELWTQFVEFMTDVRDNGGALWNGQYVQCPEAQIGLIMECGNFTVTGSTDVSLASLDSSASATINNRLTRTEARKYWGLHGAVTIGLAQAPDRDKTKKPGGDSHEGADYGATDNNRPESTGNDDIVDETPAG